MIVLQQLLPLLRFDGYYVLSDLTGVPDILVADQADLPLARPRAPQRARSTSSSHGCASWSPLYLLALVPTLTLLLAWIVMSAPRTFATAHDSFGLQLDRIARLAGFAEIGVGAFRIAALVMPLAAMSLSSRAPARMGLRGIGRLVAREHPARGLVAVAGTAAAVGAIAFVWWPNGDYEPIRPGERGTLPEAVRAVPSIPSGRPSLTPGTASPPGATATPTVERGEDALGHRASSRPSSERAPSSRALPQTVPRDRLRDAGSEAPSSIWDDGDWSTAPEGESPPRGQTYEDGGTSPTSIATPGPTSTTEAVTPEATVGSTPTATPIATETPVPTPTSTPTESAAPTPTETPTSTPTPADTIDPAPTQEAAGPMPSPTPTP